MPRAVERLRAEMEALVTQAPQQDEADEAALGSRRGDELPAELARREERLTKIDAAMRRLGAQAQGGAQGERQRRGETETERAPAGPNPPGQSPPPGAGGPRDK